MIGMRVGREQAHGHAVVGALLDAPTAEGAGGVTVDQQRQQQVRRILFAAGATGVDLHLPEIEGIHGVEDEVDEMIGRHPVAQIRREQQRSVAVSRNKAGRHGFQTRPPCGSSISPTKNRVF